MAPRLRRIARWIAVASGATVLLSALFAAAVVVHYGRRADGVDVAMLRSFQPKVVTRVVDRRGREIATLGYGEIRTFVPLDEIPTHVVQAFLAAEDARFLEHHGFDPIGIARAVAANLLHGEVRQGASTITQQVIKQVLLSPARTLERKSQELWLAGRVERAVGKRRLLEIYLNLIYLGEGRYGVEEASRYYFGRSVREIGIAEAAVLAALPKAPGRVTPFRTPDRVWARARWVLGRMAEEHMIDPETARRLAEGSMPVGAPPPPPPPRAPEVVRIVQQALADRFGAERLPYLGATVVTTLDLDLQEDLRTFVADRLGPDGPEAALLVADVESGDVLAHIGGKQAVPGMFDRVTMARRQPASTFKPVVYGAAIEARRISPVTLVPADDRGGLATVRTALARSNNTAARHVWDLMGARAVRDFARRLGFTSPLHGHPSLALGTAEVTPREVAVAYGTLAAGGRPFRLRWIDRVETREGVVPWETASDDDAFTGIAPQTAAVLSGLLTAVVEEGTGRALSDAAFPVAGKTGTSDDARDAWFAAYTPQRVAVAWVGHDDNRPLGPGAGGARTALPLVRHALTRSRTRGAHHRSFQVPADVSVVTVDARTGGLACGVRSMWHRPRVCSGFWIFASCTPGGPQPHTPHLVCSDPDAYVDVPVLPGTEPSTMRPQEWWRVFSDPTVVLLRASLKIPETAAPMGEGPVLRAPEQAAALAPLSRWVREIQRALPSELAALPSGVTYAGFELSPAGELLHVRVTPPGQAAPAVRRLLDRFPPPPPTAEQQAGPALQSYVQLAFVIP